MSNENNLVQQPLHLFKPTEKYQRLDLMPATLDKLKAIKGPIAVITIVGTQRGGKSTLLNLLHSRKTSGFGLGKNDKQIINLPKKWQQKEPK